MISEECALVIEKYTSSEGFNSGDLTEQHVHELKKMKKLRLKDRSCCTEVKDETDETMVQIYLVTLETVLRWDDVDL